MTAGPFGPGARRVLDIEDALRWAFRDELPKRGGGTFGHEAISPMFRYADLVGRVDESTRDAGFPAALGDPHPDALAIEGRVLALERFAGFCFDSDAGLFIGLKGFGPDQVRADRWAPPPIDERTVVAHAAGMMVGLIANHARSRRCRPHRDAAHRTPLAGR
jgi:hypothetical protein